ncbi:MAG: hypothetical protein C0502_00385 [Opitutus sp.]|nr:hypothetical protein [Opitutus sp.]
MSVVLSHPSVAPFVQHAARALWEAGLLDRFFTTLVNDERSFWQNAGAQAARLVGRDLRAQLRRRAVTGLPPEIVTTLPFTELVRLGSGPLDRSGRLTDRIWSWAEPAFDRRVARRLPQTARAVYCFEYCALATFRAARTRGLATVYDAPSPDPAYVRGVVDREVERFPVLDTPYHRHTRQREAPRLARRREERDLADILIAASTLTRDTYVAAGFPVERVRVVPYGAPPTAPREVALSGGSCGAGKLRLLWAGTFSIRKGAHYVLEAWRRGALGRQAMLKVHGTVGLPDALLHPVPEGIEFGGSIPRDRLAQAYHEADALLFPTLCDGFGMVATEAWSHGLPVITTKQAGAADFLRDRENGLLIEAGQPEAIAGAVHWCLGHRSELAAMREPSLATAARWQWADYRRALAQAVRPLLDRSAGDARN